jgi:CheY-like chemotaxis protein
VPAAAAGEGALPASRNRGLDGLHVLVVEDSPDDREWLARALAAFGARVTPATSVREAMAVLARDAVDVVVSDVRLPGEDGYDLIRLLRADDMARGRKTAAVAITAYARVEDRERALVAGYQMHVPKPVDPAELAAVIASVAGRVAQPSS